MVSAVQSSWQCTDVSVHCQLLCKYWTCQYLLISLWVSQGLLTVWPTCSDSECIYHVSCYSIVRLSVCIYRGGCEGCAECCRYNSQYLCEWNGMLLTEGRTIIIWSSAINSRCHVAANRASVRSGFPRHEPRGSTEICSHYAKINE
jgi:hypothetical protein